MQPPAGVVAPRAARFPAAGGRCHASIFIDRGLTLTLRRSPIGSLVVSTAMASASTTGSSGWQLRSDLSVSDAVVDNDSYWCYFELCMTGGDTTAAGGLAAQAVRVLYSLP